MATDTPLRISNSLRRIVTVQHCPPVTASEWEQINADDYVQMRLAQLKRADQKVREIKTNFNTYLDYFEAFSTFPEMHAGERLERAMDELATKPRNRVYAALVKEIGFALVRIRRVNAASVLEQGAVA